MSELLKVNVNEHTEKKGKLTYLSWAWAWAEVLKTDPLANWQALTFDGKPCMYLADGSAMVSVQVTIKGDTKSSVLPVMNHQNKAINNPDSFAVNTAIMRCLAKAIGMHGLGLYIYAGEDLPEGEEQPTPAERAADWLSAIEASTDVEALAKVRDDAMKALAKDDDKEAWALVNSASRERKAQLTLKAAA